MDCNRHVIPEPVTNIIMNYELFWDFPQLLPSTGFGEYNCLDSHIKIEIIFNVVHLCSILQAVYCISVNEIVTGSHIIAGLILQ